MWTEYSAILTVAQRVLIDGIQQSSGEAKCIIREPVRDRDDVPGSGVSFIHLLSSPQI